MCLSCIGRQILNHWATWEAPRGQRSASFQLAGCKNPDSVLGLLWHLSVGEGHLVTFRWRWKSWLSMGSPLTLYLGQGLLITCWDEKLWLRYWTPSQWGDRLTFLYPGSVEILAPISIALTRWHRAAVKTERPVCADHHYRPNLCSSPRGSKYFHLALGPQGLSPVSP